jgi:hypothetical protein
MISVDMTIREMIGIATSTTCSMELYERIVKAIELASGEGSINVTLRTLRPDSMIPAIKALRLATGWGLKESKDFCDVVRGPYRTDGTYGPGAANTLRLNAGKARELVKQWKDLGCDVVTDTYNC